MKRKEETHSYKCLTVRFHEALRHSGYIAVAISWLFEGKVDLVLNDRTERRFGIHSEGLTVKHHIVDGTIIVLKSQIRF